MQSSTPTHISTFSVEVIIHITRNHEQQWQEEKLSMSEWIPPGILINQQYQVHDDSNLKLPRTVSKGT